MNDALAATRSGRDPIVLEAVPGVVADVEPSDGASSPSSLPTDHPSWQRDVLSISARARTLLATIRPFVIKVLTFWDHGCAEITLGSRTFGVDASGCYRLR